MENCVGTMAAAKPCFACSSIRGQTRALQPLTAKVTLVASNQQFSIFVANNKQLKGLQKLKAQAESNEPVTYRELADGSLLFNFGENDEVTSQALPTEDVPAPRLPPRLPSNFRKQSPIPTKKVPEEESPDTDEISGSAAADGTLAASEHVIQLPPRLPSRFSKSSPIPATARKPLRVVGQTSISGAKADSPLTPDESEFSPTKADLEMLEASASDFASSAPSRPASKFTKRSPIARASRPSGQTGAWGVLPSANSASTFPAVPSAGSQASTTNGVALAYGKESSSPPPSQPKKVTGRPKSSQRTTSSARSRSPDLESARAVPELVSGRPPRLASTFVKKSPIANKTPSRFYAGSVAESSAFAPDFSPPSQPSSASKKQSPRKRTPAEDASGEASQSPDSSLTEPNSALKPSASKKRTTKTTTRSAAAKSGTPKVTSGGSGLPMASRDSSGKPARLPSKFFKKALVPPSPIRPAPDLAVPPSGENNGTFSAAPPAIGLPSGASSSTNSGPKGLTGEGVSPQAKRGKKKTNPVAGRGMESAESGDNGDGAVLVQEEETTPVLLEDNSGEKKKKTPHGRLGDVQRWPRRLWTAEEREEFKKDFRSFEPSVMYKMTDLKLAASNLGLKGTYKLNKAELIALIQDTLGS